MNSLVSIIVPAYNASTSLQNCIKAVLAQSYKNIEVIIIDDGSTDDTALVCKELQADDKRVTVLTQRNMGVSGARNAGLRVAKGDFIMFVDSDDALHKLGVEALLSIAQRSSADIVCGDIEHLKAFPDVDRLNSRKDSQPSYKSMATEEATLSLLYEKEVINGPVSKLYKHHIAQSIEFPTNISIAEDLYYNFLAIKKAERVAVTREIIYFYVDNPDGAMKSEFSKKKMDGITALKQLLKEDHNPSVMRALHTRLFKEAMYISIRIGDQKDKFLAEYNTCLGLIKKLRWEVILNANTLLSTRIYALLAIIMPASSGATIGALIRFKDRMK